MENKFEQLTRLLIKVAKAHHHAFEQVNGEDPEWPRWYAENIQADFEALLDRSVSVDGLADLLKRFDELHEEEAPEEKWMRFYAHKLLEFYAD
ncbi:MAG: hypothetical protein PVF85_12860 [Anaerolineales bacterium]|jgi:hypothetical protein